MGREILVVKREALFGEGDFHGFVSASDGNFIDSILNKFEYRERNEVETDSSWQQPIPYVWIINPSTKKIFAYQRASNENYNEKRLGGKWSCGVGGHIDKETENLSRNPIEDAMMRELKEEVKMKTYPEPRIVGYINDDSNPVGSVHFGIVALAETTGDVSKGDEEMVHGQFYSISEIENIFSNLENEIETWTQISWPFVKNYLENL
jgi:predicted NUDIX family phosphoesterase